MNSEYLQARPNVDSQIGGGIGRASFGNSDPSSLIPTIVSGNGLLNSSNKRSFGGTFGNQLPSGESIPRVQREVIPGELFEERWRQKN